MNSQAPDPGPGEVIVDLLLEAGLFHLELANLGATPARNISCHFAKPLHDLHGRDVATLPLFTQMPFLMPGKRIRTLLGPASSLYAGGQDRATISITITYQDQDRGIRKTSVEHDLSVYRDLITRVT